MNKQALIFIQFLRRDLYVYAKRFKRYITNYVFIYPLLFTFSFGYLLPKISMDAQQLPINVLVTGIILLTIFPMAFHVNLDVLIDLEQNRFIDYQLIILSPRLVLFERMVFSSLLVFVFVLPFYPFIISLLHNYFDMSLISWPKTILLLLLAAIFCSIFSLFLVSIIKNISKIRFIWRRCNFPLLLLGGFLVPWKFMYDFSPLLGYVTLFDPMLYITEGLRQAIIGGPIFLPYLVSVVALVIFSGLCMLLAFYFFKQKMDHI